MIKEWHEEIDSSWHDKGLSDLEILLKGLCESRTNFVGCFGHPPGLREATRRLEVVSCLFYSITMPTQNSIDTLLASFPSFSKLDQKLFPRWKSVPILPFNHLFNFRFKTFDGVERYNQLGG